MRRLALAAALIGTMLHCGAATPAQAEYYAYTVGYAACEPFPPGYPRGWELMVRRPCVLNYGYAPYYGAPGHYPTATAYLYRPSVHLGYRNHRRPYLRPGWWW
jgi:hypothetical protein